MSERPAAGGGRQQWAADPVLLQRRRAREFVPDPVGQAPRPSFRRSAPPQPEPAGLAAQTAAQPAPGAAAPPSAGAPGAAQAGAAAPAKPRAVAPAQPAPPPARRFTADELDAASSQAFARGAEEGRRQAQAELERVRAELAAILEGLSAACEAPEAFFDPLKRLALRLGEALARKELTASGHAIDALLQHALAALREHGFGPVRAALNPDDLALLRAEPVSLPDGLDFVADPALSRGSVRLTRGERCVEDFIEHRLEALAARLLATGTAPEPAL